MKNALSGEWSQVVVSLCYSAALKVEISSAENGQEKGKSCNDKNCIVYVFCIITSF